MAARPAPAPKTSPRSGRPHCADNDCALTQAEAMKAQAQAVAEGVDVLKQLLIEWQEVKPHIQTFAEIGGKWLRFCLFVRKWFPRVGWWLLPLVWGVIFRGGGEASDAALQALTAWLHMQAGTPGG